MFECKIRVSNSEQSYVKKSLQYEENVIVSQDSPLLQDLVNKAKSEFKGEVEDAVVTLKLVM